jgi:hypothetical protein
VVILFVFSCAGSGLATGLITRPRSPTNRPESLSPRTDTCNVMRILCLDVTTIIARNARRMVRSDPSAGGFFLEHKGFGLGSHYTFGRLFSVYACVDVCSRTRKIEMWNEEN